MRHGKGLRKFGRTWSHRRAMLRNLATSFLQHGRFETTVEKAKEIRPVVEKLITLGRNDTLPARRQAYSFLLNKVVVHKLFADIGPSYRERNGGYTRIVKTRVRHGDAAEMAVIELVAPTAETKKGGKKATTKKTTTKKATSKKAEPASEAAATA